MVLTLGILIKVLLYTRVVIYHLQGDRKSTQEEKKFKIPDDV